MVVLSDDYTDMLTEWPEVQWNECKTVWTDPQESYTIEYLGSQWDYELEGFFLAHCIGTKHFEAWEKVHRVYSVKDSLGFPHCTILCARSDRWSPYGNSADLGTIEPFWPETAEGPELNVLQVRGRNDLIAMLPFHQLVRQWYEDRGGKLQTADSVVDKYVVEKGDHDYMYHYEYKLNTENHFTWSYHNGVMGDLYRRYGLSL